MKEKKKYECEKVRKILTKEQVAIIIKILNGNKR